MERQERDQKIFELYESGWRSESIGKRFGITRGRVVQILRNLGYTPRSLAKINEQDFRRLHTEGLTNPQLAAEFVRRLNSLRKLNYKDCGQHTAFCRCPQCSSSLRVVRGYTRYLMK